MFSAEAIPTYLYKDDTYWILFQKYVTIVTDARTLTKAMLKQLKNQSLSFSFTFSLSLS